jgi:transcription termination factor Rho
MNLEKNNDLNSEIQSDLEVKVENKTQTQRKTLSLGKKINLIKETQNPLDDEKKEMEDSNSSVDLQNNSHNQDLISNNFEFNRDNENQDDLSQDNFCKQNKQFSSDDILRLDISTLNLKSISELRSIAQKHSVNLNDISQKQHIINSIVKKVLSIEGSFISYRGVLEILEEAGGFGFLRLASNNFMPSNNDIYVPASIIKKFNLETGYDIYCKIKNPNSKKNEKYYPIDHLISINGININDSAKMETIKERRHFDELVPCYPNKQYKLENRGLSPEDNLIARILDIMSPIGKGQRSLIVAPPRVGKTTLLKAITNSLNMNYPEIKIFVLLIDERPEEVTDMKNSIKGEVISSTFDEAPENHVHVAEMTLEMAKRLVEAGEDVVIILDSITRLARAYNTTAPSSGKVLTGGVDSGALQRPKRLFGAARNIQGGGSLTIIGSALVETGSRMDEVIFEEFKGTGNSEIVLDRKIAERRIFPAFDILKSGTRKEELLLDETILQKIWLLRRALSNANASEALELIRDKLIGTKTNQEFLNGILNQK